MTQASQDSEFGGAPGPIQPPPHELTNVEQLRLERRLSTTDPEDTIEAARLREGSRLT
jgi:hypothetical protein